MITETEFKEAIQAAVNRYKTLVLSRKDPIEVSYIYYDLVQQDIMLDQTRPNPVVALFWHVDPFGDHPSIIRIPFTTDYMTLVSHIIQHS